MRIRGPDRLTIFVLGHIIEQAPCKEEAKVAAKRAPKYRWDAHSIRALRHHLSMTQQEMSEELGVRQQTVSDWELGYHRPRGGMARLLTIVAERAEFEYRTQETDESDDEHSFGS
jgi:DNA-binding transcriptional regulator YiaG